MFFWIAASVAEAAAVNSYATRLLLANSFNAFKMFT